MPNEAALAAQAAQAAANVAFREQALFGPETGMTPHKAHELRKLTAELTRRKIEGLKLYEPLPTQNAFHMSDAQMALLRGSNRGGKTLPAAVEVARAVTGQDPHGKYPQEGGRCFCIGKDLSHVGQVMWRKLGRSGAFKIIRDLKTKAWRAFRPWDPADLAREKETKPAPPLIPPRLIKEIAWENKKEMIPHLVRLTNGWEIVFYSSLGEPPNGNDIDLFWFDEEIVHTQWYPEMVARILDRQGRGLWSATPQAGTEQLYELHERAEKERGKDDPAVEEFIILLMDNPHIREKDKQAFSDNLSDDERRVRIGGDFAISSFKVYPEFSMLVHGCPRFEVPADWTRIMVTDPGHQICAVLFAAVPPPDRADHVYLYDELYIAECDAVKYASLVAHKVQGQHFHTFLIDPNGAILTDIGHGRTVGEQYSEELRKRGITSETTQSNFRMACDVIDAGLLAVHGWLGIRQDGTPKIKVLAGSLPSFEYEVKRYHKKRVNGLVIDKPDQKRNTHLMDCLRYLALLNPRYSKPPVRKAEASGARKAFLSKQNRDKERNGGSYVRFGPGKPGHSLNMGGR